MDTVDLSELSVDRAEQELGYLVRERLSQGSSLGVLLIQAGQSLVMVDSVLILRHILPEDLAPILLEAGLSEQETLQYLIHLGVGASALDSAETGEQDPEGPGPPEE